VAEEEPQVSQQACFFPASHACPNAWKNHRDAWGYARVGRRKHVVLDWDAQRAAWSRHACHAPWIAYPARMDF